MYASFTEVRTGYLLTNRCIDCPIYDRSGILLLCLKAVDDCSRHPVNFINIST